MLVRHVRPGPAAAPGDAIRSAFDVLARGLEDGFPPGLAAAVVDRDGIAAAAWGGWARGAPHRVPVVRDTVFDLASLTKVVATTPVALRLAQEGRWSLDDPLTRWLPRYRHRDLTLLHCLTHTTGLPSHQPFYRVVSGVAGVRQALFAVSPAHPPGTWVEYSDLNFMLLGWAAERSAGQRLDVLAERLVLAPLGLSSTRYRPPAEWRSRMAASEVHGVVHDENARALDGVSGHAGLFSTLDDLARFAGALLVPATHPVLDAVWLEAAARCWAGEPPDERGLGWRVRPVDMAPGWPDDTVGHSGFTGTSLVVSPAAGMAAVLLSNATHPVRRTGGAGDLRRAFHAALAPAPREPGANGRGVTDL
jgi:CubicO group peptidase (beta-lactamase class C family)